MSHITYVKSAQDRKEGRSPYTCWSCYKPIEKGQAYAWFQASRFSRRLNWHQECNAPRPSAMETNEKRSMAMAAFEEAHDALDALSTSATYEDVVDQAGAILADCADGVREAAEACRESASSIEDGFGHETESSQLQNEWADDYDSVADECESDINYDELDESDIDEDTELDDDEKEEERTQRRLEFVVSVIDAAHDVLNDAEGSMP